VMVVLELAVHLDPGSWKVIPVTGMKVLLLVMLKTTSVTPEASTVVSWSTDDNTKSDVLTLTVHGSEVLEHTCGGLDPLLVKTWEANHPATAKTTAVPTTNALILAMSGLPSVVLLGGTPLAPFYHTPLGKV